MSIFTERFLEERRRLKLNQQVCRCRWNLEALDQKLRARERAPYARVLVKLGEVGVNVCYLLTGKRISTRLGLGPMQRAVLDDSDRCSHEKQIEVVRYIALLAKGATPGVPAKQVRKSRTMEAADKRKKVS